MHEKYNTTLRYDHVNEQGEKEIVCIARGQPESFERRDVMCKISNEKESLVTYLPNEELISNVVDLSPTSDQDTLKVGGVSFELVAAADGSYF